MTIPKNDSSSIKKMLDITGRVAIITGGAGFLGVKHAEAIAEGGGIPVLFDIDQNAIENAIKYLKQEFGATEVIGMKVDITKKEEIEKIVAEIAKKYGHIDILINNAANNPKMESKKGVGWSKFENFPLEVWNADIVVGLTGAFLCSQAVIPYMLKQKKGVIVNVSSDLGLIAPDQSIYKLPGMTEETQPYKPPTYCAVKGGLIMLTKYLATYYSKKNIRINTLTPASVFNNQDPEFLKNISKLIPMGRMSEKNEFKAALLFLVSDASSYMTGGNLVIDGGRTAW